MLPPPSLPLCYFPPLWLTQSPQEFTVRDSTWYPVGLKNDRFVLEKRSHPNGVQIAGNGASPAANQTPSTPDDRARTITTGVVSTVDADGADRVVAGTEDLGLLTAESMMASGIFETPKSRWTNAAARCRTAAATAPTRVRNGGAGGDNPGGGSSSGDNNLHDGAGEGGRAADTSNGGRGAVGCSREQEGGVEDSGFMDWPHRIHLSLSEGQKREALTAVAARFSSCAGEGGAGAPLAEPVEPVTVGPTTTEPSLESLVTLNAAGGRETIAPAEVAPVEVVGIMCRADPTTDMFQLGRLQGPENDFVVRGPLHQSTPGGKVCGPVSRYAVRLLVDRAPPHRCRVYTGGFNSR